MIQIKNLIKIYGPIHAVDDISFEIHEGEILGFLGPNGAGKSTTLKILTGFIPLTSGEVTIRDLSLSQHSLEIRALLGYLPEQNPLYEEMMVYDYLEFIAQMRGMTQDQFEIRLDFVIAKCGLKEVITQTIQTLSKGYRQRVGIAQAILHDPAFLILDEPTSGLDPNQILEIRELIRDLGKEKTVILSSHILQEIQAVADRIVILNKGKIIADGKPRDLQLDMMDKSLLHLTLETNTFDRAAIEVIPGLRFIEHHTSEDSNLHQLVLEIEQDNDPTRTLAELAMARQWLVLEMHKREVSLEDIFHKLTLQHSNPQQDSPHE